MKRPEREYSSALWLIGFKMPVKMRFLLGEALPSPSHARIINEWLHFSYALMDAPHTTKQLFTVTRFIAGIRAVNEVIKIDSLIDSNLKYNDMAEYYTLEQLIKTVPIVTLPKMMYPKRYEAKQQTGRKNLRKRVKAHYEVQHGHFMGLHAKKLYYYGLMTIHSIYATALHLEEFITARNNEYTNQKSKPDHKRALSTAVAYYHSALIASDRDKWPIKLPKAKRIESDRKNLAVANKVLKQKRNADTRKHLSMIKKLLPQCTKANGKPNNALIADKSNLPLRTVQRHVKNIIGDAK